MDALIDLLIHYGYWGMLTSALLAGSILPFSSEAVMLGLMAAFLPVIGSAITVSLGLMRANAIITLTSVTLGKIVRYVLLIYGVSLFF